MASGGRFCSGHADGSPYTGDDFREMAAQHERRATEWGNPGSDRDRNG